MQWNVIVEIGRVTDAAEYRLYRDGGLLTSLPQAASGGLQYAFLVMVDETVVNLEASAVDAAGNESIKTPLSFPLDSKTPAAPTLKLIAATWIAGP